MITASSRWLSVIMVCLVATCHQAHPAERPAADRPPADQESLPELSGPNISAFSLRAAHRILTEQAAPNDEVAILGGITRPLGLLYDPDAQDLIIFGEVGD